MYVPIFHDFENIYNIYIKKNKDHKKNRKLLLIISITDGITYKSKYFFVPQNAKQYFIL